MTEPKKFRFPFIELLSLSAIILCTVVILWPPGERYVYKLVTGKELNDGGEVIEETQPMTRPRPDLVYAPSAEKSITEKIAAEIRSLPGIANNEFPPHAQHAVPAEISGEIHGVISNDNDFETPYRSQPIETPIEKSIEEAPIALPADSVIDNTTLDEPLSFDDSFGQQNQFSQHSVPELPAPDFDNSDQQFSVPPLPQRDSNTEPHFEDDQFVELGLPDAQYSPDTELTSPLDAAPEQAPTNQIDLELDTDYTQDVQDTTLELMPPESVVETYEPQDELPDLQNDLQDNLQNDLPIVRQLPVWEPKPLRVVNGSLTPMTTPRPSPSGWKKEISDEGAVVWKSNVAGQQELPANELAPTVKQVVAPKIQMAHLPQMPSPVQTPLFSGGIIPEHVPGARRKMMSESMQSSNDFELPEAAGSSTNRGEVGVGRRPEGNNRQGNNQQRSVLQNPLR